MGVDGLDSPQAARTRRRPSAVRAALVCQVLAVLVQAAHVVYGAIMQWGADHFAAGYERYGVPPARAEQLGLRLATQTQHVQVLNLCAGAVVAVLTLLITRRMAAGANWARITLIVWAVVETWQDFVFETSRLLMDAQWPTQGVFDLLLALMVAFRVAFVVLSLQRGSRRFFS